MKDKKIESVLSTLCFSLFNVFFLMQHFSLWGCIYTLLTIAYYIVRINVVGGKHGHYGVSEWLGTYFGAMFANFILAYGFELNVFEFLPQIGENHMQYGIVSIIVLAIGLLIIKLFDKFGQYVSKVQFWIKNILLGILACVISSLFVNWDLAALVVFVYTIVFLGIFVDFIGRKNNETTRGFYAARMILMLFIVLSAFYSELAVSVVDVFYNIVAFDYAPWYYYIGVLFVLITCAVHSYLCRSEDESFDSRNLRVYCALIFAVVALLVFTAFYTTFTLVFVLEYLVINMLFLFPIIDDRWVSLFNVDVSTLTLKYVVLLIMSLLLPIAFFYGWILQMAVVFIAVIGIFIMEFVVSTRITGNRSVLKEPFFWHYALLTITILSLVCAFLECNNWVVYVSVLLSYIVSMIALITVEHKNILQPKAHIILKSVIIAFGAIFMICAVNQTNIDVSATIVDTDETTPDIIAIDIQANENSFSGVCAMLEPGEDLFDISKVYDISDDDYNDATFLLKNGIVIVSLTDTNGTKTIYYKWFFSKECYEKVIVGRCDNDIGFEGSKGEVISDQYFDEDYDVSEEVSDYVEDSSLNDGFDSSQSGGNY